MDEQLERAIRWSRDEARPGKVQKCHKARAHKQLMRRRKEQTQITKANGAFDAGENGENDDKQKDFAKRLVLLPSHAPFLVLLGGAVLCVRAPNPFVPLPGQGAGNWGAVGNDLHKTNTPIMSGSRSGARCRRKAAAGEATPHCQAGFGYLAEVQDGSEREREGGETPAYSVPGAICVRSRVLCEEAERRHNGRAGLQRKCN